MPPFWDHNNRWRAIAFPALYLAVIALLSTRKEFWDISHTSAAPFVVVFVTAFAIEIGYPSQIDYVRPQYSSAGRVGFGAIYAFAWTSLGLAGSKIAQLVLGALT